MTSLIVGSNSNPAWGPASLTAVYDLVNSGVEQPVFGLPACVSAVYDLVNSGVEQHFAVFSTAVSGCV